MNKKRTIFNLGMVLSLTLASAIFLTFITTPVFSQGNSTANVNNNSSLTSSSSNNSTAHSNSRVISSGNTTNTSPK